MPTPTEEEISRALEVVADRLEDGTWLWSGIQLHSDTESRTIVRFCLILGVPVSDILSASMFAAVVDRLILAEERVARLEEHIRRDGRRHGGRG